MPMKTDELRTVSLGVMPTPAEIEAASPTTDEIALHVARSRQQVEAILSGQDSRLLVIVGPCSIHDPEAALDYAKRLHALQEKYRDQLFIVMRTYFEKPRTVVGWKGLVSDPHLDGSLDLVAGLHKARKLLVDVNALGMPTATEFLDMVTGQYLADLITWGAIGARTTESQIHREMASGLSCPVGFKNGTDGNIQIAIDAIRATRARLVIDFSHGNCQKQHKRQLDVAADICQQIQSGSRAIAGIMAESFIVEGNQAVIAGKENELQYGCSITDPCLGWDDTATMIDMLADAVKATQN
ncbi:3-deoxy-7-phosphoheptulonate synthase [Photobacterium damselae]